mgnify:CR=1 FL=1
MMSKNKIIKLLMDRDGISHDEAEEMIVDALDRMFDVNYDPTECENILQEELGLEPDYIFDLL